MHRYYRHCPQCHKRMTMFSADKDGERRFYFCRCGERRTYNVRLNGMSDDWPPEIFDEAVRQKVIAKTGRVL
jgi:hypothetical protein